MTYLEIKSQLGDHLQHLNKRIEELQLQGYLKTFELPFPRNRDRHYLIDQYVCAKQEMEYWKKVTENF